MRIALINLAVKWIELRSAMNETAETMGTLQTSMAEIGLKDPISVMTTDTAGTFLVVSGFRRFEAAIRLGWTEIDCEIVAARPLVSENRVLHIEPESGQ